MGLQDDFEAETASLRKGPSCHVALLLQTMPSEDKAALEAAFANIRWTASGITRALNKNGYEISIHTVQRHRRGECQCHSQTT